MIRVTIPLALIAASACTAGNDVNAQANEAVQAPAANTLPFTIAPMGVFQEPWAMAFLPGGSQLLVTEKGGTLKLVTIGGGSQDVLGVPAVAHAGQGGLGDVVLHPDFAKNGVIYLSYAEPGTGDLRGAAVARAQLVMKAGTAPRLNNLRVIWRQTPKVAGNGHYGHRIAFAPDGHMFISSGERQKFDPAQDMQANLGKIVRLNDDGSVPSDNPSASKNGATAQIWTIGHRNPLGLAFDAQGQLWDVEMGPKGGDELNRVEPGKNYGYPLVSNGDHYDGKPIPDHNTRPDLAAPAISWTPVISPSSMIFYSGDLFPQWKGSALISGLSSKALVRVSFSDGAPREAERFAMGQRIRAVAEAPDGAIWLLEDGEKGTTGRLLKLTPKP